MVGHAPDTVRALAHPDEPTEADFDAFAALALRHRPIPAALMCRIHADRADHLDNLRRRGLHVHHPDGR